MKWGKWWRKPFDKGVDDKAAIWASREKEIELYINTPGIPLHTSDGKFSDHIQWWEDMRNRKKFLISLSLSLQVSSWLSQQHYLLLKGTLVVVHWYSLLSVQDCFTDC